MKKFFKVLQYLFGAVAVICMVGMITGGESAAYGLFPFFFSVLLCIVFSRLRHRSGRLAKPTINDSSIHGPFVLYLRSFVDDATTGKSAAFLTDDKSEEESLVSVLTTIGPVYAIGDPKDEYTPLGAKRIYVDDSQWKDTVKTLAGRAEAVVLRLGNTSSFWWEVKMSLEEIPRPKLLFAIPSSTNFDSVSILYKYLLEKEIDIAEIGVSIENKPVGSLSGFLYFNKQGEPVTAQVASPRLAKITRSYKEILQESLQGYVANFVEIENDSPTRETSDLDGTPPPSGTSGSGEYKVKIEDDPNTGRKEKVAEYVANASQKVIELKDKVVSSDTFQNASAKAKELGAQASVKAKEVGASAAIQAQKLKAEVTVLKSKLDAKIKEWKKS